LTVASAKLLTTVLAFSPDRDDIGDVVELCSFVAAGDDVVTTGNVRRNAWAACIDSGGCRRLDEEEVVKTDCSIGAISDDRRSAVDDGNMVAANGRGSRGFAKLAVDAQNVDVATTPRPSFDGDRAGNDDNAADLGVVVDAESTADLGLNGLVCAATKYSSVAEGALNARGL
jgi:hypothetical protein